MEDNTAKAWFAQDIQQMKQTMYRMAYAMLRNEKDCEDASGNAILTAYEKLGQLGSRQSFKAWFMRILKNECCNIIRKRRETVELCEDLLEAPENETGELYRAVMRLKEEYRLCVILYYLEGYRVGEISAIMNIPGGTVKSNLFRARAELKLILGGEDGI